MTINEPDYTGLDQSKPLGRTAGNLVRAAIGEPTTSGACTHRQSTDYPCNERKAPRERLLKQETRHKANKQLKQANVSNVQKQSSKQP